MRGLSGHGTQILAGAGDPDRACKVACQDEYLSHRYYLVYGEQGYFPFGTQCSTHGGVDDNRYCVNGQCLVSATTWDIYNVVAERLNIIVKLSNSDPTMFL